MPIHVRHDEQQTAQVLNNARCVEYIRTQAQDWYSCDLRAQNDVGTMARPRRRKCASRRARTGWLVQHADD